MGTFVLRLVINAVALWVAAYFVDGIVLETGQGGVLLAALVFGLINALIRPIIALATCPFYILTLGLFTLVVNAFMLMLTAQILGNSFVVVGFIPALLGGIIIGVVSTVLSLVLIDD